MTEAMVLRICRFWKRVGWELTLDDVGRQLGCLLLRQTMMLRSWGPTMMLRNWDWTTKCTERWGVVSIVWLRNIFKNCLSPRVEEPKSEVNKCIHSWTTKLPVHLGLPIGFCICLFTVDIDIFMVVNIQQMFCGILPPGFVQYSSDHTCIIVVKHFLHAFCFAYRWCIHISEDQHLVCRCRFWLKHMYSVLSAFTW